MLKTWRLSVSESARSRRRLVGSDRKLPVDVVLLRRIVDGVRPRVSRVELVALRKRFCRVRFAPL